ncbi:hypothetical protein B0H10DRAFT_2217448 [Mycena sp. CBHHK59/15]|nr:hypothetical protein B0H10DRAFT_2217448 [Mycena sp. CBHHK59/15]
MNEFVIDVTKILYQCKTQHWPWQHEAPASAKYHKCELECKGTARAVDAERDEHKKQHRCRSSALPSSAFACPIWYYLIQGHRLFGSYEELLHRRRLVCRNVHLVRRRFDGYALLVLACQVTRHAREPLSSQHPQLDHRLGGAQDERVTVAWGAGGGPGEADAITNTTAPAAGPANDDDATTAPAKGKAKLLPAPTRKPRISRSRVIAKLASQRVASGSSMASTSTAASAATRKSFGGARARSSLGVKVQRGSLGGMKNGPSSASDAKKRARQSEYYAKRKSRGGANAMSVDS